MNDPSLFLSYHFFRERDNTFLPFDALSSFLYSYWQVLVALLPTISNSTMLQSCSQLILVFQAPNSSKNYKDHWSCFWFEYLSQTTTMWVNCEESFLQNWALLLSVPLTLGRAITLASFYCSWPSLKIGASFVEVLMNLKIIFSFIVINLPCFRTCFFFSFS